MGLLLLLGTLACVSLLVGSSQLPARQVLGSLLGQDQPMVDIIVWQVRLPRTLLAIIVGGSLALAGAVLQGLLRNPLAEPGLIGVSGAAALGAVIAFYTGLVNSLPLALPLGGLLGAALAVASLLLLAGRSQSTLTLILAGVAVNSLAGALTALALSLSPNPFAALEIVFWMLGSLANRGMDEVWLAASLAFPGCLCMLMLGRGLTALTLGESVAISLGVDMQRLRWLAVLSAALAVGASVSVTG
ncbi:MAG: iron ABC transporter permease, partial [Gammaproteobacteria bacterium]|nr:iron ABC transporter permease [Gammaproteobacteria bacterium]